MPVAVDRSRAPGRTGLIDRHDLVAALDRAAGKQVTIISAPAGSGKTSLLRAWADRPGQDRRVAFMSVRPGQQDAQLFWLALLGTVRAAVGRDGGTEPPPVTPGFSGGAMVEEGVSELARAGDPGPAGALAVLRISLPDGPHAIVAPGRAPPLRLHQLRLSGELTEIRAGQ